MAQLNITLNQDEILQLLSNDREAAFARLLQDCFNSILKADLRPNLKRNRMSVRKNERAAETVFVIAL